MHLGRGGWVMPGRIGLSKDPISPIRAWRWGTEMFHPHLWDTEVLVKVS